MVSILFVSVFLTKVAHLIAKINRSVIVFKTQLIGGTGEDSLGKGLRGMSGQQTKIHGIY